MCFESGIALLLELSYPPCYLSLSWQKVQTTAVPEAPKSTKNESREESGKAGERNRKQEWGGGSRAVRGQSWQKCCSVVLSRCTESRFSSLPVFDAWHWLLLTPGIQLKQFFKNNLSRQIIAQHFLHGIRSAQVGTNFSSSFTTPKLQPQSAQTLPTFSPTQSHRKLGDVCDKSGVTRNKSIRGTAWLEQFEDKVRG